MAAAVCRTSVSLVAVAIEASAFLPGWDKENPPSAHRGEAWGMWWLHRSIRRRCRVGDGHCMIESPGMDKNARYGQESFLP